MFNDVENKIKKRNQILFSRETLCLQELRNLICEQKHLTLVLWAFDCLEKPVKVLLNAFPNQLAPQDALETCKLWASGKVKMPVAKRAILDCHAAAKTINNPYYIALYHAVGQGCATVHVESHALGLVFYELTAIVINNNYKNYENEVLDKILFYIDRLKWWQDNIESYEKLYEWADFIVRPNKPNKEKLLFEKQN